MKKKVQIEEVQRNFQQVLAVALKGADVIIMDKHKAVAKLVRIDPGEGEKKEDKWTTDDFNIQLSE
jgi:antitoxin (DNA-binding transcriptional repressor) of toxin-antitoxin stability system